LNRQINKRKEYNNFLTLQTGSDWFEAYLEVCNL